MSKLIKEFCRRGLMAAWGGPVVVAIIYAVLGVSGAVETFTVREVVLAILSSTLMAFIAAGIPVVYQAERLPLPMAILIHCGVLYLDYILVYLINGWLKNQWVPILVFTAVFMAGFALIWAIIYLFTKKDLKRLNRQLQAR